MSEEKTPAGNTISADSNKETENKSFFGEVLDWIESFVFAVFLVLLVFIFLFRTVCVDGSSMNPTLSDSERLILTHFSFSPDRGDIIVANSEGLGKTIIKRCIGVGGDHVVIDYSDSSVTVNGEVLDEYYLGEDMELLSYFDETYQTSAYVFEYDVPEGYVFALGDNRNNSRDSRDAAVGFISSDDILGKAVLRYYPFDVFSKLD